jgi:hypothetical protein
MIVVGWRLRDGISAHNAQQLMSAHPSRFRPCDPAMGRAVESEQRLAFCAAAHTHAVMMRGEPVSQAAL